MSNENLTLISWPHMHIYTHLEVALEVVKSKPLHSHDPHDSLWSRLCKNRPRIKLSEEPAAHELTNLAPHKAHVLSGPPSCVTASTKRSWSSTVHRSRGLGSVVRTSPESPWTHIGLSFELTAAAAAAALVAFLEGNILFSPPASHARAPLAPLSRSLSL
jgi:hypothetical protein